MEGWSVRVEPDVHDEIRSASEDREEVGGGTGELYILCEDENEEEENAAVEVQR